MNSTNASGNCETNTSYTKVRLLGSGRLFGQSAYELHLRDVLERTEREGQQTGKHADLQCANLGADGATDPFCVLRGDKTAMPPVSSRYRG